MTGSTSWLGLLLLVACAAAASPAGSFGGFQRITTSTSTGNNNRRHPTSMQRRLGEFRGGAAEEYDSDYDSEYDDDEDEPIVKTTRKLASSTKAVAQKKKAAAIKSKVKVAMASSSSAAAVATKRSSAPRVGMYKRYVPYIVRACVNPFTLVAMIKAYFVSLCDINYLKEEPTQTLRSALEDKARKQQPAAGGPPKRKMKPGQAKTLSDLPQLSA